MNGQQDQLFVAFIPESMRDAYLAAFPEPDNQTVYTVKGLARDQWFCVKADAVERLLSTFHGRETLLRAAKVTNQ